MSKVTSQPAGNALELFKYKLIISLIFDTADQSGNKIVPLLPLKQRKH
jgi:hypothetical protein